MTKIALTKVQLIREISAYLDKWTENPMKNIQACLNCYFLPSFHTSYVSVYKICDKASYTAIKKVTK